MSYAGRIFRRRCGDGASRPIKESPRASEPVTDLDYMEEEKEEKQLFKLELDPLHPFSSIPPEMSSHIFSYLSRYDIVMFNESSEQHKSVLEKLKQPVSSVLIFSPYTSRMYLSYSSCGYEKRERRRNQRWKQQVVYEDSQLFPTLARLLAAKCITAFELDITGASSWDIKWFCGGIAEAVKQPRILDKMVIKNTDQYQYLMDCPFDCRERTNYKLMTHAIRKLSQTLPTRRLSLLIACKCGKDSCSYIQRIVYAAWSTSDVLTGLCGDVYEQYEPFTSLPLSIASHREYKANHLVFLARVEKLVKAWQTSNSEVFFYSRFHLSSLVNSLEDPSFIELKEFLDKHPVTTSRDRVSVTVTDTYSLCHRDGRVLEAKLIYHTVGNKVAWLTVECAERDSDTRYEVWAGVRGRETRCSCCSLSSTSSSYTPVSTAIEADSD